MRVRGSSRDGSESAPSTASVGNGGRPIFRGKGRSGWEAPLRTAATADASAVAAAATAAATGGSGGGAGLGVVVVALGWWRRWRQLRRPSNGALVWGMNREEWGPTAPPDARCAH